MIAIAAIVLCVIAGFAVVPLVFGRLCRWLVRYITGKT
jgi:antibiotic biosynthesis monooxygenase (ABM) superfamily enzyme